MLNLKTYAEAQLALPKNLPDLLQITITYKSKEYTLDMTTASLGSDFEILEHNADGLHHLGLPPFKLYRGDVQGIPNSLAAAMLLPDGRLDAFVRIGDQNFSIHPNIQESISGQDHILYEFELDNSNREHQMPLMPAEEAMETISKAPSTQKYSAVLGLDCAYDYVELCGGKEETILNVVSSLNKVFAIYLTDLGIQYNSGLLVLRTDKATCPYSGITKINECLDKMKETWNQDYSNSRFYTNAQLITSAFPGSGLTFLNTVCNKFWSYGVSGSNYNGNLKQFDIVLRHEMGHTWGAPDLPGKCLAGKTIMCGNQLPYFSPYTVNLIKGIAAKKPCLT